MRTTSPIGWLATGLGLAVLLGQQGCPKGDGDGDGWTTEAGDCDDTNADVNPAATEVCGNGVDENCNGFSAVCDDGWLYYSNGTDLYALGISGVEKTTPFQTVDQGGWSGDVEVSEGLLYYANDPNLYVQEISGADTTTAFQPVGGGDAVDSWGDMEVSDGWLYFMQDNTLSAGAIIGGNLEDIQVISRGGWSGDIEVEDGWLYLMKEGRLLAGLVNGPNVAELNVASAEGWEGDFAVADGWIYLAKDGSLYSASIDGDTLTSDLYLVDADGWNTESGDLEVEYD